MTAVLGAAVILLWTGAAMLAIVGRSTATVVLATLAFVGGCLAALAALTAASGG